MHAFRDPDMRYIRKYVRWATSTFIARVATIRGRLLFSHATCGLYSRAWRSQVDILYIVFFSYSYASSDVFGNKYKDISNLIEHPVPVHPPGEPAKSIAIPVILTSKERKKLRKQRRREAEREKQEKIQFGLIDKPEPKVPDTATYTYMYGCSVGLIAMLKVS